MTLFAFPRTQVVTKSQWTYCDSIKMSLKAILLPVTAAVDDFLRYFPKTRIGLVRIEQQAAEPYAGQKKRGPKVRLQ
jgi:hypothetical protein